MLKILNLICLSMVLVACGNSGGDTKIDEPERDAPSSLRWDNADLPITINFPSDFTLAQKDQTLKAGKAWEDAFCDYRGELLSKCENIFFVFIDEQVASEKPDELFDRLYDGKSVIYKMIERWFSDRSSGELATTTLLYSSNTMIASDILFNFKTYNFGNVDTSPSRFDFESIMIHEMGHMLGFNHTSSSQSVMLPNISSGQKRRSLTTYSGNACIAQEDDPSSFSNQAICQELREECESTCNGMWNPEETGDAFNLFSKYENIIL